MKREAFKVFVRPVIEREYREYIDFGNIALHNIKTTSLRGLRHKVEISNGFYKAALEGY